MEAMINFKIYAAKNWEANNYNTHIVQYLKRLSNQTMKSYKNVVEKLLPDPFLQNQVWACLSINNLTFYTLEFYRMYKSKITKICWS